MHGSIRVVLATVCSVLVTGASAAAATTAAQKPDAHDRVLVRALAAKVAAFKVLAKAKSGPSLNNALKTCPAIEKDPAKAFGAVFALLPALLIELVNDFKPEITGLRDTLAGLHPHAQLFQEWATASSRSFELILRFDNHGKHLDYCQVITVMLDKHSTPAQVEHVLGVDPSVPGLLFGKASTKVSETLKRLNPRMRLFLLAAGVPKQDAVAMTK